MIKASKQLYYILLLIITLIISNNCFGQFDYNKYAKISEFSFESIFGAKKSEPNNTYTLLGTGFFRSPRSNNIDSLVNTWIKKHPSAVVTSVSSISPITTNNPNSKLIYCWVMQGSDTLNIYLVRNGACPGGTMLRPRTNSEEGKTESKDSDTRILIDKKTYDDFIEKVKVAELYARNKKLGIWADLKNGD
ncbi:hypothetical protein [Dysgonomonas sp. ZJ279]|uniref:hypothetical protein n=1 Tax=Dysgonomonas sp. ZJ279 TaxID=2709796 RepID=UPI0013ED70DF|nr:hypothetical protein [Dysgonomonas sp. ZJ279]